MIAIGIDPGSRYTGWGIVETNQRSMCCVAAGRIALPSVDHAQRLVLIFEGIESIVREYQPAIAAIETVFVNKNARSALVLGQARGAAIVALAKHNLMPYEISPRLVKKTVSGSGAMEKEGVALMVMKLLGMKEKVSLDASDALAIAISSVILHGEKV